MNTGNPIFKINKNLLCGGVSFNILTKNDHFHVGRVFISA